MPASVASTRTASTSTMVKKKVDDRIKILIDDAARLKHRGLVMLVGDRAKDQIPNFHLMVSRANHSAKVNVLWCMKNDVDFGSTGKKQQERRARLEVKGGLSTEATKEAFQTFLSQTHVRFCKYKETHKVLGQTFGMAVLQDFEAINPNTLARTMETVRGGGIIIIMFRAMRSLKQLYTIAMDVHARYRTESQRDVVPRFNERFLLSLTDCDTALCLDDDLHVLPITAKMKNYGRNRSEEAYDTDLATQGCLKHEVELMNLKEKLKPSAAVGPLVALCQTLDQAKTVLALMQTVTEKSLDTTCVVTAGRGRGKSAALGIAAAGGIAQGYSNIFCTAPTPENLQTFFEFAIRGLKDMGYAERTDFEALQGTSEEFAKCIIRINVFREHRQTIQFVSATDTDKFAQAELAIIDEAAALPLPLVKKMIGPYLVFLSSTISGYEGTGRSLSMKLVADMRKRSGSGPDSRLLREISMKDPIRYGPNDPVESWLNKLLCLDATENAVPLRSSPHPNSCELYYINRDALFSYHPLAEELLQRVQSLLVAAHYKNQPNDLQLLSDAPGHHLFVLCSATVGDGTSESIPDIFTVIHVCEEGQVSSEAIKSNMSRGLRPAGDLIPYTLSQYYLEEGFAKLAGLRVVRIATNPELQHAGYGSRALALLHQYYSGTIALTAATEADRNGATHARQTMAEPAAETSSAMLVPREHLPNLLTPLHERPYELLDYLGVSFGLTTELFNFWKRAGYQPLYVRQAASELTGEHSCVMVRPMGFDIGTLKREFRARFIRLLALPFRRLPTDLSLSILADIEVHDAKTLASLVDATHVAEGVTTVNGIPQASFQEISNVLSAADLKRLRLFSSTFIEGGNVLDLIPAVAKLYYEHRLYRKPDGSEGVVLSHAQAAVLLAVGLQCQTLDQLAQQSAFAGTPVSQLRAFFQKAVSRLVAHFHQLQTLATGKRTRDSTLTEDVQEIRNASGDVVGLTVAKKMKKEANVDTTLLRDASTTVAGGDGKEVHKDLQNVFRRPKTVSKRK